MKERESKREREKDGREERSYLYISKNGKTGPILWLFLMEVFFTTPNSSKSSPSSPIMSIPLSSINVKKKKRKPNT